MKLRWSQLGGQMGIALGLVGLFLVFLGWNGAASYDRVPAQFPYLISGGIAGLSLVVLGAAMIIVQNARKDSAALQHAVAELRGAVEKLAAGGGGDAGAAAALAAAEREGLVAAGPTSYHRPSCHLLEGRGMLPTMTVERAEEQGLLPCRTCDAADLALPTAQPALEVGGRRRR